MKYSTPELQLVGAAQGLVLGSPSFPAQVCVKKGDPGGAGISRNNPDF